MIKTIIFDYDGVIVNSFPAIHEIYQVFEQEMELSTSVPKDINDFKKMYGYNYIECLGKLGVYEDRLDEAQAIFKREIVTKEQPLYEGIENVLKELSKEYTLILLSANRIENVTEKLQKLSLDKYFSELIADGRDTHDKLFSKSNAMTDYLERAGLGAGEVISIGDRNIDFDFAAEAGLPYTILTDYGWGHTKENHPWRAATPQDIPRLIKEIQQHGQK